MEFANPKELDVKSLFRMKRSLNFWVAMAVISVGGTATLVAYQNLSPSETSVAMTAYWDNVRSQYAGKLNSMGLIIMAPDSPAYMDAYQTTSRLGAYDRADNVLVLDLTKKEMQTPSGAVDLGTTLGIFTHEMVHAACSDNTCPTFLDVNTPFVVLDRMLTNPRYNSTGILAEYSTDTSGQFMVSETIARFYEAAILIQVARNEIANGNWTWANNRLTSALDSLNEARDFNNYTSDLIASVSGMTNHLANGSIAKLAPGFYSTPDQSIFAFNMSNGTTSLSVTPRSGPFASVQLTFFIPGQFDTNLEDHLPEVKAAFDKILTVSYPALTGAYESSKANIFGYDNDLRIEINNLRNLANAGGTNVTSILSNSVPGFLMSNLAYSVGQINSPQLQADKLMNLARQMAAFLSASMAAQEKEKGRDPSASIANYNSLNSGATNLIIDPSLPAYGTSQYWQNLADQGFLSFVTKDPTRGFVTLDTDGLLNFTNDPTAGGLLDTFITMPGNSTFSW